MAKQLVQFKVQEGDIVALRPLPTVQSVQTGIRYSAVLNVGQPALIDLQMDTESITALRDTLTALIG